MLALINWMACLPAYRRARMWSLHPGINTLISGKTSDWKSGEQPLGDSGFPYAMLACRAGPRMLTEPRVATRAWRCCAWTLTCDKLVFQCLAACGSGDARQQSNGLLECCSVLSSAASAPIRQRTTCRRVIQLNVSLCAARVYMAGSSGAVLFCLHGCGYTGLTWACVAAAVKDRCVTTHTHTH